MVDPRSEPRRAAITGVAIYVPERVLTNAELARSLDTSDEWIITRTGIRERRIGKLGETTSTMGAEAVRRLMAQRQLGPQDIDALIVATVTPDMLFPATACLIQDQLGLTSAWGFDLSAACSGFLYALTTGAGLVASGAHQRVVVVGADLMSSIIDPLDRTTAVLFGDGAGAVLLEPAENGFGIMDFHHRVDGSGREDLLMPAGGCLRPPSVETVTSRVRLSISGSMCSTAGSAATRHSTPRCSSRFHGVQFDGNSSAVVTTLSRSCHRSPCATNDNPSDVFLMIAISLASAPISRAALSRTRACSAYHSRQCSAPKSRWSRACPSIASHERIDRGPTAA